MSNLGYVKSEDLLEDLVKQLTLPDQIVKLDTATLASLKQSCWHLFRKLPAQVKQSTERV